jgi:hypothetical protein
MPYEFQMFMFLHTFDKKLTNTHENYFVQC